MAFEKGTSGNPGGRPKEDAEVKALAREHGPAAIQKLADLMDCGNPRTECAAAVALLDRGYGKPTQPVGGDEDLPPIKTVSEIVIRGVAADRPSTEGT